jgi:MinD-like ATPase involved in chromosome partitioning or flagellar assembly/ActR/RegA family two-component response regulator
MPPKCSVLLVEDSPDSAMLANHFLGASKIAQFRVVPAASLHAAREALGRERFDAILLDLNLPDSRGIETFSRLRELAGGAAIVILTGVEDEGVATAAIGHGAADYLIKGELGGEGLARRVRFAVERNHAAAAEPAHAGRVSVFASAKGGAGVSTTAINIAAALARRERNVVLLELRPQAGALAAMLNVQTPLTLDMLPEFGGSHPLESASGKLPFGARLVAAPAAFDGGLQFEPPAVDALLDRAAAGADHVLIDASAALPELLRQAVGRAVFTTLVVEREPLSVQLAARMVPALAAWSGRGNAFGAALVNHMPFVDVAPLPAIRSELGCGIVGVLPPAREVLHSYRRQGPIVLAQPGAPVSVAFDELAGRLDQDPVPFLL